MKYIANLNVIPNIPRNASHYIISSIRNEKYNKVTTKYMKYRKYVKFRSLTKSGSL